MEEQAAAPPASPQAEKEKQQAEPSGGLAFWPVCLPILLGGLILDHATKLLAVWYLKPDGVVIPAMHVIPGCLRLVYAENTGAAFSLFSDSTLMLGFVSLIASVGIGWFWWSLPAKESWGRAAAAMILSGAIGNMIDRFYRGFVVDFIDAYFRGYHWPTFNIADSLICVGVGILAVRFLQGKI